MSIISGITPLPNSLNQISNQLYGGVGYNQSLPYVHAAVTKSNSSYGYNTATLNTSVPNYLANNEITINNGAGTIRVAETLQAIISLFGIILPNQNLMADNPVLKEAYENYVKIFKQTVQTPELKEAIDSYKVIETMVKDNKF